MPDRAPRWKAALLAAATALVATAAPLFAYSVCVSSYSGSCLASETCVYFDNATGRRVGAIRVEYEC